MRNSFANPAWFAEIILGRNEYELVPFFLASHNNHISSDDKALVHAFIQEMIDAQVIPRSVSDTFWIFEKLTPESERLAKPPAIIKPSRTQLHALYHVVFKVGITLEDPSPTAYLPIYRAVLRCFLTDHFDAVDRLASEFSAGRIDLSALFGHPAFDENIKKWALERMFAWNLDASDPKSVLHILLSTPVVSAVCVEGFERQTSDLIKFALRNENEILSKVKEADAAKLAKNLDHMISKLGLEKQTVIDVLKGHYGILHWAQKGSLIFLFVEDRNVIAQGLHLIPMPVYRQLDRENTITYLTRFDPGHDDPSEKELDAVIAILRKVARGEIKVQNKDRSWPEYMQQVASSVIGSNVPSHGQVSPASVKMMQRWGRRFTGPAAVKLCRFVDELSADEWGMVEPLLYANRSHAHCILENVTWVIGEFDHVPKLFSRLLRDIELVMNVALTRFASGKGDAAIDVFFNDLERDAKGMRPFDINYIKTTLPLEYKRLLSRNLPALLPHFNNQELKSECGDLQMEGVTVKVGVDLMIIVPRKTRIVDMYAIMSVLSRVIPHLSSKYILEPDNDALIPLEHGVEMHPEISLGLIYTDEQLNEFLQLVERLKDH